MESLNTKVESLGYKTIERAITNFWDMGYVNCSSSPNVFSENYEDTINISATKKSGDFLVKITKTPEGGFSLYVSACGLKKKR